MYKRVTPFSIHTISGGLEHSLAQLAKARGATVIGTTSTLEKATLAKAHGADHVILYKQENTIERVRELTKGECHLRRCGAGNVGDLCQLFGIDLMYCRFYDDLQND
jgi:D-arabinose 1-dehydrogenase-like Zn-dependent alcohol dehydrogenase